jgi:hypothetical protein
MTSETSIALLLYYVIYGNMSKIGRFIMVTFSMPPSKASAKVNPFFYYPNLFPSFILAKYITFYQLADIQ